jgi:hypothetical protein
MKGVAMTRFSRVARLLVVPVCIAILATTIVCHPYRAHAAPAAWSGFFKLSITPVIDPQTSAARVIFTIDVRTTSAEPPVALFRYKILWTNTSLSLAAGEPIVGEITGVIPGNGTWNISSHLVPEFVGYGTIVATLTGDYNLVDTEPGFTLLPSVAGTTITPML